MKIKLLLFGSSGLLGTQIKKSLSDKYLITAPTRQEVNLIDKDQIKESLSQQKYDVVVYAAGFTNQDMAEKEKELAMKINSDSVLVIAKELSQKKIPLIYFSSDAVFPGTQKNKPYFEDDKIDPVNYYGFTKARGEIAVLSSSSNNLVIRLISIYCSYTYNKLDFARKILKNLYEKKTCYGIVDQKFNPLFLDDAVCGLSIVLDQKISGILHFGALDNVTNYDFASLIAKRFGYSQKNITKTKFKDFFRNSSAKRGQFSCLDTTTTQNILGQNIFHENKDSVERFYKSALFFRENRVE